ncbi:restriction endonuclease subunit S [Lysobacter sp. S4-A87]|uniref:restriction endonuclease subunit S n=1 Tax=Lysobacter sp. S4-A87 TaxID=2925843 RepID=UPI001F53C6E3|nr:restriction endonuclease subunit S [Lysobacter sp. S4-A87]UNK50549.1 restriction endonuclease subunit S [Lysobacter sp. S4-A87]
MSNKSIERNEKKRSLVPRIRFPKFQNADAWQVEKLSGFLVEIKQRNRDLRYTAQDVLSVSGELGCVNQIEHLGRSYAGVSVKDYRVVETGDLVYTKSPLKRNPFGIIKENKGKAGIVSTLYAVYRPNDDAHASYFDHYFSRDHCLNAYLQPLVKKGAKNDMKVNNAVVLSGSVVAPKLDEQHRVADCLTTFDERIAAEAGKLRSLKVHKKALTQQLLPADGESLPNLRFPQFLGLGEWKPADLDPFLKEYSERVSASTELPIYSSSRTGLQRQKDYYDNREVANDGQYGVVPEGYFVYRHMSDDGAFKFNINNTGQRIAVSKEYPVFSVDGLHPGFLKYLLNDGKQFSKFALAQKKGGTRTRLYLNVLRTFSAVLPSFEEQRRIGECISSIDDLITAQEQKIDLLKRHKRGLMQELFPVLEDQSA